MKTYCQSIGHKWGGWRHAGALHMDRRCRRCSVIDQRRATDRESFLFAHWGKPQVTALLMRALVA